MAAYRVPSLVASVAGESEKSMHGPAASRTARGANGRGGSRQVQQEVSAGPQATGQARTPLAGTVKDQSVKGLEPPDIPQLFFGHRCPAELVSGGEATTFNTA